jgi:hypothetical protein
VVDIAETPVMSPGTNSEILIYDEDGRRVLRRRPSHLGPSCGILLNLSTLPSFFNDHQGIDPQVEQDLPHHPVQSTPNLMLFPQGYLGDKGHYQSKSLPHSFKEHIRAISDIVACDEDARNHLDEPLIPIMGIASQGYNTSFHRMRHGRSSHDVQQGFITGFAASQFVTDASHVTKGRQLQAKLSSNRLPFNRFEAKLAIDEHDVDLRGENVFLMDLLAIGDEWLDSEYVFLFFCMPISFNKQGCELYCLVFFSMKSFDVFVKYGHIHQLCLNCASILSSLLHRYIFSCQFKIL